MKKSICIIKALRCCRLMGNQVDDIIFIKQCDLVFYAQKIIVISRSITGKVLCHKIDSDRVELARSATASILHRWAQDRQLLFVRRES